MFLFIWLLFLLAGVFVGGAWSGYQHDNKVLTIACGLLAVVTLAASITWMVAEMR